MKEVFRTEREILSLLNPFKTNLNEGEFQVANVPVNLDLPSSADGELLSNADSRQMATDFNAGLQSWWIESIIYFGSATVAGAGVGLAWRTDSLAFLGILGLGIFLAAQLRYAKITHCLLHGLVSGYFAFAIANPWMLWTIEGIIVSSEFKAAIVTQGIHILHGGMFCLFAGLWWFARKHLRFGWATAPAIWLLIESVYPAMFPMKQGCLIGNFEPLIQITSVLGVSAASLQVIAIACLVPLSLAIFSSKSNANRRPFVGCVCAILVLTLANLVWGQFRIASVESESEHFQGEFLTVGLVQGDTEYATFHASMVDRSRKLQESGCQLILWPECSLGKYERNLIDFSDDTNVAMNSRDIGHQFRPLPDPKCHLLAGGYSWTKLPESDQLESSYVSAYLLDSNEKMLGRHDKIELMAGGEFVPGAAWFPALGKWLSEPDDSGEISITRGTSAEPVGEVNGLSIGVLLCCEDMYPNLANEVTEKGADILVCLANGMAFNSPIALRQHFNISRFRALENNCYFIRCGSYGVSSIVSPTGRVLKSLPCFEEEDLVFAVPIEDRVSTSHSQFRNALNISSCLSIVILGLFTIVSRRRP